jgi:hypothetical protein
MLAVITGTDTSEDPTEQVLASISTNVTTIPTSHTPSTLEEYRAVMRSRNTEQRKNEQPIPLHLAGPLAQYTRCESAKQYLTIPPGEMHRHGTIWRIPFVLFTAMDKAAYAIIDTGARPTICKVKALAELDPNWREKLQECTVSHLKGVGGKTGILGVYLTSVVIPHHECGLMLDRIEFLVAEDFAVPFDFIFGRDTQAMYHFQLNQPSKYNARLTIGGHLQKWYLSGSAIDHDIQNLIGRGQYLPASPSNSQARKKPVLALPSVSERFQEIPDIPGPSIAQEFPSGNSDINYEDFITVLTGEFPKCNDKFRESLEDANISSELTPTQREYVLRILAANEDAFIIEGVKHDWVPFGEPVEIIVDLPDPIPKALKRACYPCSYQKEMDMRNRVDEFRQQGRVTPSTSFVSASTFMLYRGIGTAIKVRMIHDFRPINKYVRVPAYPIPHIWTSIANIGSSTFFSSFDIKDAFHQMILTPESRKYTAFSTPFGLFEYVTGCLGLSCMPAEFQRRIEKVFEDPILQKWLKIYIDDGLINSSSFETHLWKVFIVLRILSLLKLRVALKKCWWMFSSLKYVGYKLNGLTIAIADGRVQAIEQWETPTNRADVQSLLGHLGYHRPFIKNYAQIVAALQALLPANAEWKWGSEEELALSNAKKAMREAVELYYPQFNQPFFIYTDASQKGLGAGLYQEQNNREVPLAFISRTLRKPELRYGATQLECLAVVWSLEKFHFYIDGQYVYIITDCIAIKSLMTAACLNRFMLRWQVFIQEHRGKLTFVHRAGRENKNAEGLSCHPLVNDASNPAADLDPDDTIEFGGVSFTRKYSKRSPNFPRPRTTDASLEGSERGIDIKSSEEIEAAMALAEIALMFPDVNDDIDISWIAIVDLEDSLPVATISLTNIAVDLHKEIHDAYKANPQYSTLLNALEKKDISLLSKELPQIIRKRAAEGRFFILEGLIYLRNGLTSCVLVIDHPTQTMLLDLAHDTPLSGHFSADRTWERLRGLVFWPFFRKTIDDYCASCRVCLHAKRMTGKQFGLLQRIEMPSHPWQMVNLDFVTGLPPAGPNNEDACLLVSDRSSRRVRFIACHKTIDARESAHLFNQNIVSLHGLPAIMISDRDPRFTSDFWKSLHDILGVKLAMSTANHPQTDGLAERGIQTIEEALRAFCAFGHIQDRDGLHLDWVSMLYMLEYAYNSSVHSTTGQIPFEVDIGYVPNSVLSRVADQLSAPGIPRSTKSYLNHLTRIREHAKQSIEHAHAAAARRWNKSHRESTLEPGDWALLSTKNYRFTGLSNKLKPPFVGPYLVLDKVGPNAVRLDLTPPFHRKHPVLPVSVLKKDLSRQPDPRFVTRRKAEIPQPYATLEGQVHTAEEIESILDERFRRDSETGKSIREYLVRWRKYSNDLWIAEALLAKDKPMEDMLRSYRQQRREGDKEIESLSKSVPPPDLVTSTPVPPSESFEPKGDEEFFEISKIVNERRDPDHNDGRLQYQIRWAGYGSTDDTWEPAEKIQQDAPDLVEEWQRKRSNVRRSARLVSKSS